MILMKKYVSLTTAAIKMVKRHLTVIIAKNVSMGDSMFNHSGHFTLTYTYILRYHRDMKILKILASNSKWFKFYDIFKKW